MKKVLLIFLILLNIVSTACGTKIYSSATITRDEANTGGDISFIYDEHTKNIYFGGEGEYLQYYSADEVKGLDAGYRVGIKVIAPSEVKNLEDAVLEINGNKYNDFFEKIESQPQNYFYIYPTFSEKTKEIKFKITWTQMSKPQKYKVVLNEKTKFLKSEK
ncbi:MAG TPA: hypothetical protein IAC38_02770 [Candidatus Caccovivens faecavium]|nr:hypothetical protein [Candidatus Caccovivens faecavium]